LIERAAFPRRKVCGEFISAATLPVLEACGVARDFLAGAGPEVRTVAAWAGDTRVKAPLPRAVMGWGRALGREHLDVLLRDAAVAAGATLLQPAEVTALSRQTEQHVLRVCRSDTTKSDTADEICAPVVIVACGSWSTGGPFAVRGPPRPSDLFAFKAHLRGGALADGLMPLLAFPGGYGGMVHSDRGRVSLSCCLRRDRLARVRQLHGGKAGQAVLRHIIATTAGVRHALQHASVEGKVLATGPIHPGIRACYRDGVFFAGNAAGEAHPIIAEGISMAIQSAWLLTQCLLADDPAAGAARDGRRAAGWAMVGRNYSRAWKRQFALRLRAASLYAQLAINDHCRAAGAQLIGAFPALLTWGAALSGKAVPVMNPGTRNGGLSRAHVR
jgi:flavin-dependent dehydrogenase